MAPPPPYRHQVAGEVRAEMARQRVTAAALSEHTGIPTATLSRRLSGLRAFNVDELTLIAEYLGRTVSSFFPEHLIESA